MGTPETKRIEVKVTGSGKEQLEQLAGGMAKLNQTTKSLYDRFRLFTSGLLGFSVFGFGASQLISFSDEMQNLNSRLIVVTGSVEKARDVMAGLNQIASENNSSIDATAQIYTRLGTSLKNTTISQEQLLRTTRLLQNSYRLSGSTIEETTGSIIQISQAFSRGALRGQELNSVLSGNALLANALRKEYGKNLFKEAEKGAITTAKVFKVLFDIEKDVNEQAKTLTPTISQTLTKAMNTLKNAVFELNQTWGLSSKFAEGMNLLIEKIPLIGVAITVLAVTQIPRLITSLTAATTALTAFAVSNPYTAGLAVIGLAIVYLYKDFDELKKSVDGATQSVKNFLSPVLELGIVQHIGSAAVQSAKDVASAFRILGNLFVSTSKESASAYDDVDNLTKGAKEMVRAFKPNTDGQFLKDLNKQFGDTEKLDKLKEILGRLNKSFLDGKISVQQYSDSYREFQIDKVKREFKEGKFALDEYNKRLNELSRQGLNRQFNDNVISIEEFNRAIANSKIKDLQADLDSGKISLSDFRVEVIKLSQDFSASGALAGGIQGYLNSIGTGTQQVAGLIQQTMSNLENVFVDFMKKGKANFAEFTQAILDDLLKIILRAQVIQPLAQGILNFLPGSAGTPGAGGVGGGGGSYISPVQALGGAWDNGVQKFAKGGVVNRPTTFNHRGGTGLMGEAGPEAILPLTRGRGGALGVQATASPVNIVMNNYSSAEVETKESTGPNGERMIEIMISNKMKEAFNSGTMDKTMASAYGIRRKGG